SLGGGDVTIFSQGDIFHATRNAAGALIPDSSKELPNNWLYRRGYLDPLGSGQFGVQRNGDTASTTWWIDFSNFFECVGALGGGKVRLVAGGDIINIDAAVPTNARMPKGIPDATKLVELGGGDLLIRAGGNIDGGVYYVERGRGELMAGGEITTNGARSSTFAGFNPNPISESLLPTTLFVGKSSFDVS